MNRVKAISPLGQQIWLDYISHELIQSGTLARLIEEDGLCGVTSNPAIFKQAILQDKSFQALLAKLPCETVDAEARFEALAIPDIQLACDAFADKYAASHADTGYVSFEVSPAHAHDTDATIAEARRLWALIGRRNAMIKIPASAAGLPAITASIADGINVNVTLIFSLAQARAVADAYCRGLRERLARGLPIDHIRSVASFFISRIDSKLDPILAEKDATHCGKIAIAQARVIYAEWQQIFSANGAFQDLAAQGARPQWLLWASTGVKNPLYRDVMYVEQLIGADTVNTVPEATLNAFRDHGEAAARLPLEVESSRQLLDGLPGQGIDLEQIGVTLQQEGLALFETAFAALLAALTPAMLR